MINAPITLKWLETCQVFGQPRNKYLWEDLEHVQPSIVITHYMFDGNPQNQEDRTSREGLFTSSLLGKEKGHLWACNKFYKSVYQIAWSWFHFLIQFVHLLILPLYHVCVTMHVGTFVQENCPSWFWHLSTKQQNNKL